MTDELERLRQQWERLDLETTDSPRQREALRAEARRLDDAAYSFYQQSQLESARSLYHRAYEAAVQAGDRAAELKYLYWEGHCLGWQGQLRAALACLLQLEGGAQENKEEYWLGLIEQISLASQLPLSLDSIQRLIDRCRQEMVQLCLMASQGMLLIEESDLASYRGDTATALAKAQEAISAFDESVYPKYIIEVHYRFLIDALLDAGRREEAERWLERYEGVETRFELGKEVDCLSLRRRLALEDKDYPAAWRCAQRQLQRAREGERCPYAALRDYCDTAIQCGHLSPARNALAELLIQHRNSEIGHRRYELQRLAGDYHRAMACRYDDQAASSSAAAAQSFERVAQRHRKLARRYYGFARTAGLALDEKLRCDWRRREMEERLASL